MITIINDLRSKISTDPILFLSDFSNNQNISRHETKNEQLQIKYV